MKLHFFRSFTCPRHTHKQLAFFLHLEEICQQERHVKEMVKLCKQWYSLGAVMKTGRFEMVRLGTWGSKRNTSLWKDKQGKAPAIILNSHSSIDIPVNITKISTSPIVKKSHHLKLFFPSLPVALPFPDPTPPSMPPCKRNS